MTEIIPAIITLMSFLFVLAIIKTISDNKVRHRLIEKGLVDEKIKYLYGPKEGNIVPSSLKWGLVLIFLGIAILVAKVFDFQEFTIGFMFLFSGAGLILYYSIVRYLAKEADKKNKP